MHHREWGLGRRLQNADTCVSKEPKYRGLDGEATECRLCKHCGCALNVSQVAQRRLDPHADQKQEINFVWLDSTSCQCLWSMIGFSAALPWTGRPPWLHSQNIFYVSLLFIVGWTNKNILTTKLFPIYSIYSQSTTARSQYSQGG